MKSDLKRLFEEKNSLEACRAPKTESSGEDPKATPGLVSQANLSHPRVNKTKQHTRTVTRHEEQTTNLDKTDSPSKVYMCQLNSDQELRLLCLKGHVRARGSTL